LRKNANIIIYKSVFTFFKAYPIIRTLGVYYDKSYNPNTYFHD
jgi:hypothetical protein